MKQRCDHLCHQPQIWPSENGALRDAPFGVQYWSQPWQSRPWVGIWGHYKGARCQKISGLAHSQAGEAFKHRVWGQHREDLLISRSHLHFALPSLTPLSRCFPHHRSWYLCSIRSHSGASHFQYCGWLVADFNLDFFACVCLLQSLHITKVFHCFRLVLDAYCIFLVNVRFEM